MSKPLAVVRASSWSELGDCALRWYFRNVVGLRLPATGRQMLGTAIHAGTAVWDRGRIADDGSTRGDAIEATTRALVEPAEDVNYTADDLTLGDALLLGRGLTEQYIDHITPTHTFEAVEVQCTALDVETDAGVVRLTGTTDRIRRVGNERGIADLKTGRTAVGKDGRAVVRGHGFQLGIYQLMAEAASGEQMTLPAEVIGLHARPQAMRVGIGEIANAKRALVGTGDVPGVIELAARMLKAGLFPPNPKSILCSARYCPGYSRCNYHD